MITLYVSILSLFKSCNDLKGTFQNHQCCDAQTPDVPTVNTEQFCSPFAPFTDVAFNSHSHHISYTIHMPSACDSTRGQIDSLNNMLRWMHGSHLSSPAADTQFMHHMLPHHKGGLQMTNRISKHVSGLTVDEDRLLLNLKYAHEHEIDWQMMMLGKSHDDLSPDEFSYVRPMNYSLPARTGVYSGVNMTAAIDKAHHRFAALIKKLIRDYMTCTDPFSDFLVLMAAHHAFAIETSTSYIHAIALLADDGKKTTDNVLAFARHIVSSQMHEYRFMSQRWSQRTNRASPLETLDTISRETSRYLIGPETKLNELRYGFIEYGTSIDAMKNARPQIGFATITRSGAYEEGACGLKKCMETEWGGNRVIKRGKDGKLQDVADSLLPNFKSYAGGGVGYGTTTGNNSPFPNEVIMGIDLSRGTALFAMEIQDTQHNEGHHSGWSQTRKFIVPWAHSAGDVSVLDPKGVLDDARLTPGVTSHSDATTNTLPIFEREIKLCKMTIKPSTTNGTIVDGAPEPFPFPYSLNARDEVSSCSVPHTVHVTKMSGVDYYLSTIGDEKFEGVGGVVYVTDKSEVMNMPLLSERNRPQGYDVFVNSEQGLSVVSEWGSAFENHFTHAVADKIAKGKTGMEKDFLLSLLLTSVHGDHDVQGFGVGLDLFDVLSPLFPILGAKTNPTDTYMNNETVDLPRGYVGGKKVYGYGATMYRNDGGLGRWEKLGRVEFGTGGDYTGALAAMSGGQPAWTGPIPNIRGSMTIEARAPHIEWASFPADSEFNARLLEMVDIHQDGTATWKESAKVTNAQPYEYITAQGPSASDVRQSSNNTVGSMPLRCLANSDSLTTDVSGNKLRGVGIPDTTHTWTFMMTNAVTASEMQSIFVQDVTGAICWRPTAELADSNGLISIPASCLSNIPNFQGRLDKMCVFSDSPPELCEVTANFPRVPAASCAHLFGLDAKPFTVNGNTYTTSSGGTLDERDSIAINLIPSFTAAFNLFLDDGGYVVSNIASGELRSFCFERNPHTRRINPMKVNSSMVRSVTLGGMFQNDSPLRSDFNVAPATDSHWKSDRPKRFAKHQCHPSRFCGGSLTPSQVAVNGECNPCKLTNVQLNLDMTNQSMGHPMLSYEERWNMGIFEVTSGPNSVQLHETLDDDGHRLVYVYTTTSVYTVWDYQLFGAETAPFTNNNIHPQKQWGQMVRAIGVFDPYGCVESLDFDTEWGIEPGRLFFEAYNADTTGMVRPAGAPVLESTLPGGPHEIRFFDGVDAQLGGFA